MFSAAAPRVAPAATAAAPRSARDGSPARGIPRATVFGTRARKPPCLAPSPGTRSARPATTRRAVPDAAQALAVAETVTAIARDAATRAPSPALGDLAEGAFGSPAVPLLAILGGLGIYKAAVYWRVQFITASMIGKHVPPGARRVLEYGVGQGKNLYYYPKSVGMVVGIDPEAKEDLLIQVSIASSVPFVAKKQALEDSNGQPDGSIDAVVSTGSFGKVSDPEALLTEAARVLKPGAPLVFVEDLGTLGEKNDVLDAITKSRAAETFFEKAQYDDLWATLPLAPTAIGVAVRKGEEAGNARAAAGGAAAKKKDDFETATGLSGKRGKRKKK
jgi:SAM-dependent methyltransferase